MCRVISVLNVVLMTVTANCYFACKANPWLIPVFLAVFLIANLLPFFSKKGIPGFRLKVCNHGYHCLRQFLCSVILSVLCHIALLFYCIPDRVIDLLLSMLVCFLVEAVFFWNGMICLYCTSAQLGVRERVIGAACGMIPIVNLIALNRILKIVSAEVEFETQKAVLNASRKSQKVCETKYPILLVHGIFFRDYKFPNYWGRIPGELIKNGATLFYGEHQSARSVADSAAELTARIKDIVENTGCQKVNVIAHSKGGLDCRYALHYLDAAPYVASLTTINTPHRGCKFADYLLEKAPESLRRNVENTYNKAFRKLGDKNPDFMAAVTDITSRNSIDRDKEMCTPECVYSSSVGSKMSHAVGGKFPLNLTYRFVHQFDGGNDGLVGEESFAWGEEYTFLKNDGKRGISHGDMIDLNRENIPGFDVREFYVQLVHRLQEKGL